MRRDNGVRRAVLGAVLLSFGVAGPALGESRPGLSGAPAGLDRGGLARACLVAAAEAEARLGLPSGLLAAVAVVESAAHPFAVGVPARSHYAATREEAVRVVSAAGPGAAGGCFQINVGVHARRDPAWVFDPWRAALFAGRMLLRDAAAAGGDWGVAIARYAGARPGTAAARQQRCRVAASLAGLGHAPPRGLGTEGCAVADQRVARAKAVTLAARARGPDAVATLGQATP